MVSQLRRHFWRELVSVQDFKIQNIVGSCDVKFPIRLEGLAYAHGHFSSVSFPVFLVRVLSWNDFGYSIEHSVFSGYPFTSVSCPGILCWQATVLIVIGFKRRLYLITGARHPSKLLYAYYGRCEEYLMHQNSIFCYCTPIWWLLVFD